MSEDNIGISARTHKSDKEMRTSNFFWRGATIASVLCGIPAAGAMGYYLVNEAINDPKYFFSWSGSIDPIGNSIMSGVAIAEAGVMTLAAGGIGALTGMAVGGSLGFAAAAICNRISDVRYALTAPRPVAVVPQSSS